MTDDNDLVKKLRAAAKHPIMDNNCIADVFDVSESADRIEALEAKLAKAVKVLVLCRDMFDEVAHPSDPMSVLLNTTLAELEGDNP
jgi:hypothetical protein